MRRVIARALVLSCAVSAFSFNHPEIRWQSVTTDHFVINYYDRTEPALYATWKIAEDAYAQLSKLYDYHSERKIALSLADYDDYSNGWADWLSGAIMIWVPDDRFELRGNTTWLRNVISHELTHIMTLTHKKKMIDWTLAASYSSPSVDAVYQTPMARMTLLPDWLTEGVAQLGSERLGNDRWDSRRDMILRCAVLQGQQLTLDQMSTFSHDALGDEMVYDHGYSFTSYLRTHMGDEAFDQMFTSTCRDRVDFYEYFALKAGKPIQRMYADWVDSVGAVAKRVAPKTPTPTQTVWDKGFLNEYAKVSSNGKYWGWLTNAGCDDYRTDLVIATAGSSRPVNRIDYAQTAWCFSSDGERVYFVKARRTDSHGSMYNDLYVADVGSGGVKRLTRSGRIYDVAASPDGKSLVLTRFDKGVFGLSIYSLENGAEKSIVAGSLGAPFVSPSFNPANPSELVVARVDSGTSDLFRVNIADGSLTPIAATRFEEESPVWAADGRIYFDADYDGIDNIYSVKPDGSDLRRHSHVVGGLFAPALTADGKLLCGEYVWRGYHVVTLTPENTPFTVPDSVTRTFQPVPTPTGRVEIQATRYRAKLLRPYMEMESFVDAYVDDTDASHDRYEVGDAGMGMTLYRNDAVGKKTLVIGGYAGLEGGAAYIPDTSGDSAKMHRAAEIEGLPGTQKWQYSRFDALRRDPKRGPSSLLGLGRPTNYASYRSTAGRVGGLFGNGSDTTTDTATGWTMIPPSMFLEPVVYYENASLRPTLGLTAQGLLSMGMGSFMPQSILLQPFGTFQLARDLYAGLQPYLEWEPLYGTYYVEAPFWFQYFHTGRYEKDWAYTMRNITSLTVQVGPQVFPADDSSAHKGGLGAMAGGVSFTTGIPVARSASVVLDASGSVTNADDRFQTLELGASGASDIYAEGELGVRAVVPLFKNIDLGMTEYVDGLYGALYYRGDVIANRNFIWNASEQMSEDLLYKPNSSHDALVTHTVGAQLMLGVYKYSMFYRTLTADVSYELMYHKWFVNVGFGF